jgi:hypothetical protein
MMNTGMRWCVVRTGVVVAGLIGVAMLTSPARAQTAAENKAAARALGLEGIQLAMDGNCEAALDKLERAHELYFAPTIAVWLGECRIKEGQLVAGTETLQRVVREPLTATSPAAFRSAQMRAQTLLDENLPRLAKLTVNVEAPAGSQYQVVIDGKALPGAMIGVARPIDPGAHEVGASGSGLQPVSESITLPEGETDSLTLTLLPAPTSAAPVADTGTGAPPPATDLATTDPGSGKSNKGLKVGGYTALAVGGLGIIAGSAFGVSATNKRNELDNQCPDKQCPPSAQSDLDAVKSSATVSTVGFAVGGVGIAAGTALLIVATKGKRERPVARRAPHRVRVTPVLGLGSVSLEGRF